MLGFGSGREGLGLFDLCVETKGESRLEFLPFDPGPEAPSHQGCLEALAFERLPPPSTPLARKGLIAVSCGSWARGTMEYTWDNQEPFDVRGLELLIADLEGLGIGEDHFVALPP